MRRLDAFVCGWALLALACLVAICLRGEGHWWSIRNFHPRSLRGMGDDDCDGNCFGLTAEAEPTAKAFRFPEAHLPLCHAAIVAKTCGSFRSPTSSDGTAAPAVGILSAADLARRLGITRASALHYLREAGVRNLASEEAFVFACADLCPAAVRQLPGANVPPASEIGCYLAGGVRPVCDIDLSDAALVAVARSEESLTKATRQIDAAERVMPGQNDTSSLEVLAEPRSVNLQAVGRLILNMFRIFPPLDTVIETVGAKAAQFEPRVDRWPGRLHASSPRASKYSCFENGWRPHDDCLENWTYKGEHAREMPKTAIKGCTTVGKYFDGWCATSNEWVDGMPWKECDMCGVSWDDQARRATTVAQAYTSRALNGLQESMTGDPDERNLAMAMMKKWFGSADDDMRTRVISGMRHVNHVLSSAVYHFKPDRWVWGWVYAPFDADANGKYHIHLGQPYVETLQLPLRVGTLTHEAAHFKPLRANDHMYCDFASCMSFVANSPDKAVDNADHWSYFIDAMNLGRMDNPPPAK
eukprot:TRINITY_DN36806_c0_g2_i1.p1 TRINITY_DN36806_c0_g2~~TRINITY_DN36806_c0_g2_i1.p1  ORF type:complete len:528 (-),score=78.06 TRINITY_DN36806_c0_g2_i1:124-1707(-)